LAATAEGYGCNLRIPLGNEGEHAKEVLQFPEEYYMPCFIGIGKPKENASVPKQKEIDVKDRIHWNKY
ncbi:MAG: nitroreductase, partial [Lachnospiraceae bacterium]|nr:nitroreductase [Lachnospiraceae bacterium]